jgi:hypothetical protein
MRVRSLAVAVAVLAVAALAAAVAAPAKEGVKAKLTSTIPLDASAGTRLRVSWTLRGADDNGRPYPFGANGVFVRLISASGAASTTGYAPSGDYANGRYAATVVVPDGGIGDVRIGLRGFSSGATGYRQSDMIFPITNDPMPGAARILPSGSGGSTTWIVVLVAVAAACGLLTVAFRRQRGYAALLSNRRRSTKPPKTA